MQQIQWGALSHVWFVLVCGVAAIGLLVYHSVRLKRVVKVLVAGVLSRKMLRNFSWRRAHLRLALAGFGLVVLLVSLVRPQYSENEEMVKQRGRDLLIALDISRSMLAEDVKPSRLASAKRKIEQLVNALSCERVGLILFSGSAIVQCPLTADHNAFFMFLRDVDSDSIASGTTAIDKALLSALEVYGQASDRKHKMVAVFTDGEDFSSSLARIRDRAKKTGLTIFTVGVGTPEGAPVPFLNDHGKREGFMKDARGTVVISRRNDGILQTLAHEAGGAYIPMVSDDYDVEALVAQVTSREKELFEEKMVVHAEELYPYGCALTFVLMLLEWLL